MTKLIAEVTAENARPMSCSLAAISGAIYTVYWRARDGKGTHLWKAELTEAEADAQIVWCQGRHPDATLVWSVADGANQARKVNRQGA